MRHPAWGFELPELVSRLLDWRGDDRERRRIVDMALGGDLDSCLLKGEPAVELSYEGHPFELVPLLWQGGGALQYGLLIHDEGLPAPMASFSPVDEPGPLWLGDDVGEGLANLMAARRSFAGRGPAWEHASADVVAREREETEAAVAELAEVLGLTVPESTQLDPGARSDRAVTPTAPEGWTFEPCNDDVGVLAPTCTFDPTLEEPDDVYDEEADLALAADLLSRGLPGSSLAVARNVYHFDYTDGERGERGAMAMRQAYEALGRDWLVRRVDAYLAM